MRSCEGEIEQCDSEAEQCDSEIEQCDSEIEQCAADGTVEGASDNKLFREDSVGRRCRVWLVVGGSVHGAWASAGTAAAARTGSRGTGASCESSGAVSGWAHSLCYCLCTPCRCLSTLYCYPSTPYRCLSTHSVSGRVENALILPQHTLSLPQHTSCVLRN